MQNNISNQRGLTAPSQPKFSVFMSQENIKNLVQQSVGKNAQRFTAAIISAVSTTPALKECTQGSILSGALLGEALGLHPSPQLGQYYLVPFKKKDKQGNVVEVNAQFVLGAKGYKQLAMRSGEYLDIDVLEIKEGEYKGRDRKSGKQLFEFIENDEERETKPTIGYMAYFELLNGFRKVIYWTKGKMLKHADTYAQAFDASKYEDFINGRIPKGELWKYSSFWYKNFDEMAFKTLIRHLLSQWGILSIEMQEALAKDEAIFNDSGEASFVEYDDAPSMYDGQASDTTVTDTTTVIPEGAEEEQFDFFSAGGAQ